MSASELAQELQTAADRAADLTPAFQRVVADHVAAQQEWFASAGQGTWPPHHPSTASATGRLLIDQGGLLKSLTEPSQHFSAVAIRSDEVRLGTRGGIAAILSRGRSGSNPMPARPLLDLRETTADRWLDILAGHVTGGGDEPTSLGL